MNPKHFPDIFQFLSTKEDHGTFDLKIAVSQHLHYNNSKINHATKMLENILSLSPKAIVSTNIDEVLEHCLNTVIFNGKAIIQRYLDECNPQEMNSRMILFLIHGSILKGKYILSRSEYDSYYVEYNKLFHSFIHNIFGSYTLLFLGYGLSEDDVLKLNYIKDYRFPQDTTYHLALVENNKIKNMSDIAEKHKIRLISYKPGKKHINFSKIIAKWAKEFQDLEEKSIGIFDMGAESEPV